jgi:RNA polymerase subunit RPABC4/transcription elongation factor Spt4
MMLVFFLALAMLAWLICRELDVYRSTPVSIATDCQNCHQAVAEDWLVCPRCSILLQKHCPGCGEVHASHDRFCPWCGLEEESAQL